MPASRYTGGELELFAKAVNWKKYLKSAVSPYLGASVLEVGAGLGGTTEFLCGGGISRWVCLEPDAELAAELIRKIERKVLPASCKVLNGTIADLGSEDRFDAILYVDVLEHIKDDAGEILRAAIKLAHGGRLIIISPAHQYLYSEFDRQIGHFRRYSKLTLAAIKPAGLAELRLNYLDSAGMLASCANKLLLRQAMPTPGQIGVWDNLLVPVSRLTDPLLNHTVGKSIMAVWKKT